MHQSEKKKAGDGEEQGKQIYLKGGVNASHHFPLYVWDRWDSETVKLCRSR